jgi:hypothetical protein
MPIISKETHKEWRLGEPLDDDDDGDNAWWSFPVKRDDFLQERREDFSQFLTYKFRDLL